MWLSSRGRFQAGDPGWEKYLAFIGLPALTEVRTVDPSLNEYIDDCPMYVVRSLEEVKRAFSELPHPSNAHEYYLLFLDAENEALPTFASGWRLLGHDLSDETNTSSLLNCGPWTGRLFEFTQRLNQFGLLGFEDARRAKALLPLEWPDDPHANVTIWALYEIPLDAVKTLCLEESEK